MSSPEPDEPPVTGLGERSAVAFGWGVGTSVAKVLLALVVQASLARLLGPEPFGLFALGMLVMGVAAYFSDLGMATSLVQRPSVSDRDIRFVSTLNLLIAGGVGLAVFLLASSVAQAFGKPQVQPIIRALAPVLVINALASVSTSLLRRQLDYRSIQLSGLVGYALGFGVVGITLAATIGSAQALVWAYVSQAVVTLALLYRRTRHVLGLSLEASDRRDVMAFGANVMAANLVNWVAGALDRLVVGRHFATPVLGQYSAAYNLVYAPVGALYPNLQSTVFSSMARMQGDPGRMGAAYLGLLGAVTVVSFPVFLGMCFHAAPLVQAVYGPGWEDAGRIAGPFCVMAPFLLVWAVSTPVLWNSGHREREWQVQLPFLLIAAVAIAAAAGVSVVAVAWASSAVFVTRAVVMAALACRALDIGPARAWAALRSGVWMSIVVAGAAACSARALALSAMPMSLRALIGGTIVVACALLCLLAAPHALPPAARGIIRRSRDVAPRCVRPLLARLAGTA